MAKFKVLQNNRRFLSSMLRIDIEQKNDAQLKSADKLFTSIRLTLILFFVFSILISSAVRMHNDSYDFTVRLSAFYVFIAIFQEITIFIDMGANMQKILALYRTLQQIVGSEGTNIHTFDAVYRKWFY